MQMSAKRALLAARWAQPAARAAFLAVFQEDALASFLHAYGYLTRKHGRLKIQGKEHLALVILPPRKQKIRTVAVSFSGRCVHWRYYCPATTQDRRIQTIAALSAFYQARDHLRSSPLSCTILFHLLSRDLLFERSIRPSKPLPSMTYGALYRQKQIRITIINLQYDSLSPYIQGKLKVSFLYHIDFLAFN